MAQKSGHERRDPSEKMSSHSQLKEDFTKVTQQLESARLRESQLAKTLKWWTSCADDWKKKCAEVRHERDNFKEEAKALRLEVDKLKKLNCVTSNDEKNNSFNQAENPATKLSRCSLRDATNGVDYSNEENVEKDNEYHNNLEVTPKEQISLFGVDAKAYKFVKQLLDAEQEKSKSFLDALSKQTEEMSALKSYNSILKEDLRALQLEADRLKEELPSKRSSRSHRVKDIDENVLQTQIKELIHEICMSQEELDKALGEILQLKGRINSQEDIQEQYLREINRLNLRLEMCLCRTNTVGMEDSVGTLDGAMGFIEEAV